MTTKQFTIHVADPTRPTPLVQFWGVEYKTLRQASKAIVGQYGFKVAIEILGRAFVLMIDDAQVFAQQGIPFSLGFSNGKDFTTLPGNVTGSTEHLRWVAADELKTVE